MTALLDRLAKTPVIVLSGIAMLFVGFGFGVLGPMVGGVLLDELPTAAAAATRIAELTPEQRDMHFWTTVLLDSAYPLAYGAFAIGLLARLGREWRHWTVIPAAVAVVADFLENTVQAMALAGNDTLLFAKDVLTPAKFGGLLIALALIIGLAIWRWLQRLRATPAD